MGTRGTQSCGLQFLVGNNSLPKLRSTRQSHAKSHEQWAIPLWLGTDMLLLICSVFTLSSSPTEISTKDEQHTRHLPLSLWLVVSCWEDLQHIAITPNSFHGDLLLPFGLDDLAITSQNFGVVQRVHAVGRLLAGPVVDIEWLFLAKAGGEVVVPHIVCYLNGPI